MNPSFLLSPFLLFSSFTHRAAACDVAALYKSVELPFGAKAITDYGEVQDVSTILLPTTVDVGDYDVTVTRKGTNLYSVMGHDLYIETRMCFEIVVSQSAVLKVESAAGYSIGRLMFDM